MDILTDLNKKQEQMEKVFRDLEKRLKSILDRFFKYPISPLQDWFLKVIEDPICCNSLGLPMAEEISRQLHLALASESGFSEELKRQVSHRLYEIFKIMYYIFQHPLCPRTLEFYKPYIDTLSKFLENGGYCSAKNIIKNINAKKIKYINAGELLKVWDSGNWEKFHFAYTPEPMWLNPNLLYLNYPHAFGEKANVFKVNSRNKSKQIFDKFKEKLSQQNKDDLFIDLSKLLWCIDTFAINLNLLHSDNNRDNLIEQLTQSLKKRIKPKNPFQINHDFLMKMPIPETYKTEDRILLFSVGWVLELDLLFEKINEKVSEWDNGLRSQLIKVAKKGIEQVVKEEIPNHLYLLCQRVWFLIECWSYKSIVIARDYYKNKNIQEYKDRTKVNNEVVHFYRYGEKVYAKSFFDNSLKVEDEQKDKKGRKLLAILQDIDNEIDNPIFLLGGAGIGKTTLVTEAIPQIVGEKNRRTVTKLRVIPIAIGGPKHLYNKIKKELYNNNQKILILFFDEMHLPSSLSPFALMLDPLQENLLAGNNLGDENGEEKKWSIFYIFASSAFRSKEEFLAFTREKEDIAMSDFATRIPYWIELPDLWQIPEQKFVLAYKIFKKNKKKAACITINGALRSSREIVREKYKRYNYRKDFGKNLRGNIVKTF